MPLHLSFNPTVAYVPLNLSMITASTPEATDVSMDDTTFSFEQLQHGGYTGPEGRSDGSLSMAIQTPGSDVQTNRVLFAEAREVVFSQADLGWFDDADVFTLSIPDGDFEVFDPNNELTIQDEGTSITFSHTIHDGHLPSAQSRWVIYTPKVSEVTLSYTNTTKTNGAPIRIRVIPEEERLPLDFSSLSGANPELSTITLGNTSFSMNEIENGQYQQPHGLDDGSLYLGVQGPDTFQQVYRIDLERPRKLIFSQADLAWFDNTDRMTLRVAGGDFEIIDPDGELTVSHDEDSLTFYHNQVNGHLPSLSSRWEIRTRQWVDGVTLQYRNINQVNGCSVRIQAISQAACDFKPNLDPDRDAVSSVDDQCPQSDVSATVVINGCDTGVTNRIDAFGCSLSDKVATCAEGNPKPWAFKLCLDNLANNLLSEGLINSQEKDALNTCGNDWGKPTAVDDSYTTEWSSSLFVPAPGLLANDFDREGDAIEAHLEEDVSIGHLILDRDGSFEYHPEADYQGLVSFVYRAWEPSSGFRTATVTIDVTPGNRAPVAVDDSYIAIGDTRLTVSADGVLGNDYDPDGTPIESHLVSPPTVGDLGLHHDGSFWYQPPDGYVGTVTFTYHAYDGIRTTLATVTIEVHHR